LMNKILNFISLNLELFHVKIPIMEVTLNLPENVYRNFSKLAEKKKAAGG
jgi:hypothetical protein